MAELRVEGDELVLHLTGVEKLEAVHGDLRAPRSSVAAIEVLEDAHAPADVGLKIGERLPGYSEVATIHGQGERLFAAVHHDTPRGLRIAFRDGDYDAWIVGCADPENTKRELERS